MTHKEMNEHQGEQSHGPSEDLANPQEQVIEAISAAQAQRKAAAAAPQYQAPVTENLAALRAENDDLHNRLKRVAADYLNYQKRIQKELQHSRDFANEALITALLPVLDDIDRTLETGAAMLPQENLFLLGLRLVEKKAMATLGHFGLTTIDSLGKPFDPECHCAVTVDTFSEHPPNTVVKELRKGYALKGRTIRPAMVVVSVAPNEPRLGATD